MDLPALRHFFVVAMTAGAPATVLAQEPRLIAGTPPSVELPYEFTQISEVYELADGRVVVLDRLQGEVRLADLRTGINTLLGRAGDGPGEYRAPLKLVPLGGDSVGVYDDANVRILVVTAAGRLGGFVTPWSQANGVQIAGLVGDGRGWLYGELRGRSAAHDSAPLFRWRAGAPTAEFVARIHRPLAEGEEALGGGAVRPGSFARPSTRNMWAVDAEGRLAIANFRPYHVLFTSPSGQRVVGPAIPYPRIEVNDSVKRAVLGEQPKALTGQIVDPRTGKTTAVRRPVVPVDPATIRWAREVPPFRGDAFVAFAPDGKLWIQRTTFGREGGRYDIIGSDGALIDRVRLPEGHRVVGFGRDAIYVVRRDADDLEFLQRRPLPTRQAPLRP